MDDYFAAKALLFSSDYLQGRAVINADDSYGRQLIGQLHPEQVWSYSVQNESADLWTSDLTYEPTGVSGMLHTPVGEAPFRLPLVGQYNLSNMLAAVGAVLHLDLKLESVVEALPQFLGVPGRMERVQIQREQDVSVIVDYAHTPDILEGIPPSVEPIVICDRATAIRTAILQAQPGDGILIAGKGHEDYQILGTEKIHFDDREQARDALLRRLNVAG
jgi:UDP-N-acetylmuramoyl-L-alanyl-D-glutamate--2,6-diaminopimelate ligase